MKRKTSRRPALKGSHYVNPHARNLLARSIRKLNVALRCLGEYEALEAARALETMLELPAPLAHAELAPLLAIFSERVEQVFARGAAEMSDPELVAAMRHGASHAAKDAAFFASVVDEEGGKPD